MLRRADLVDFTDPSSGKPTSRRRRHQPLQLGVCDGQ
jgi:hypothetical protein